MKIFLYFILFVFSVSFGTLYALENVTEIPVLKIESFFADGTDFWNTQGDNLLTRKLRLFFKWTSEKKDSLRAPAFKDTPRMTFLGIPVVEALIGFSENGTPRTFRIYLYTRGDTGNIDKQFYENMIAGLDSALKNWCGAEGTTPRKETVSEKLIRYRYFIKNRDVQILMKWSASDEKSSSAFRGEYIYLEFTKFDPENDPRKKSAFAQPEKLRINESADLKKNIKKLDNGDIYLDNVPMVDQGTKGYCVDASVERVFKFYGLKVDQHMIAQVANSGAGGGTTEEEMVKALKSLGTYFKTNFRMMFCNKSFSDLASFKKLLSKYNSCAGKDKKALINEKQFIVRDGGNGHYDVSNFFNVIDPDIYKRCRCERESTEYKRFLYDIKDSISSGFPALWGVHLGIVKESDLKQRKGNHMRLIIGYNEKTKEIIYTDSWGAGYEFEKISFDDAWTITSFLAVLEPRKNSL